MFLKQLRERLGYSQQQLATELGMGIATIARYEKGKSSPAFSIRQMKLFLALLERSGIALADVPED